MTQVTRILRLLSKIAMRIDYEKVLGEELEEKEKENNKEAEYCEEAYVHGRMM